MTQIEIDKIVEQKKHEIAQQLLATIPDEPKMKGLGAFIND